MAKKVKKTKKKSLKELWKLFVPIILAIIGGIGVTIGINSQNGEIEVKIDYSKLTFDDLGGEYASGIPMVDEIDGGGRFAEVTNENGTYYDKGDIEEVDTSSVEAFMKSTLGRCIIAGNVFGAQCVSLARAFWNDYAGYDVTTCGTGLAKGMMNCADENARDKFKVIWNKSEIIKGTWIVLDGKTTGHICMALTEPVGDYVQCLGENQGGVPCENGVGGAGTNIINLSLKNFIGGYIPLTYIPPEPEPEPIPAPITPDTGSIK